MTFDRLRLEKMDGIGRFRVFLNEQELNCVLAVDISMRANEFATATLSLGLDTFECDEEFLLYLQAQLEKAGE